MSSFAEIKTLFHSQEDRSLDYLSKIYDNQDILLSHIRSLMETHITRGGVENKRVLIKPNWVSQDRKPSDSLCMRTNDQLLFATVRYLLGLSPLSIVIGDAPIQGCNWDQMHDSSFYTQIESLSAQSGVPIVIKDFRKAKLNPKTNTIEKDSDNKNYIIFDVGRRSYLEPITSPKNTFRVTCYNPDRLAESHCPGVHKYCIIKDLFESDVVITMPKIKTHQKAGLTNSLKILVGINGDKDYLPHHRIGAVGHGGDCYKGWHPLRRLSELLLDEANRHIGKPIHHFLAKCSSYLWTLSFPSKEQNLQAGWYGNDTVWRMVMDLNMIAEYGCIDGHISDTPQRTLFTLCDGIIGGQGEGPLNPDPLALGILIFSNDAFLSDEIAGRLFGLEMTRVPLLNEAVQKNQYKEYSIRINGEPNTISDIDQYRAEVSLPQGWMNYNH